jgi:hypothetical protein
VLFVWWSSLLVFEMAEKQAKKGGGKKESGAAKSRPSNVWAVSEQALEVNGETPSASPTQLFF